MALQPSSPRSQKKHLPLVAQEKKRPVTGANTLDTPPPSLYKQALGSCLQSAAPWCSPRDFLLVFSCLVLFICGRSHYGRPGFLHTLDLYHQQNGRS